MKTGIACPLCKEKLYSGLGKGCKMCGMPIEENKEFCSENCKLNYFLINIRERIKNEI